VAYHWDFSAVTRNADAFAAGLVNTVLLSAAGIAVGLALGLVVALMRLSGRRVLAWPALAFVEFYRNTPPLVHLFWFFYGLPMVLGLTLSPFVAALSALGIQSAAFFAEVYRAGIVSVERGQWEAGRALGMGRARLMRRVILPQALRRMVAPFVDRSFELIKTTTLAAALTFQDLVYNAMVVTTQTYRPLEVYTAVAVIFFLLLFSLSQLAEWLDARMKRRGG